MTQEEAKELVYDYENALLKSIAKTYTQQERFGFAITAADLKLHIIDSLTSNKDENN